MQILFNMSILRNLLYIDNSVKVSFILTILSFFIQFFFNTNIHLIFSIFIIRIRIWFVLCKSVKRCLTLSIFQTLASLMLIFLILILPFVSSLKTSTLSSSRSVFSIKYFTRIFHWRINLFIFFPRSKLVLKLRIINRLRSNTSIC